MSFLAPLYALAAIAIAAPFVFHMFQRRPEGRQDFSSLMFLKPSPPQITKRHRISNWLLLLLRGLALLLLAAAFARPFMRSTVLMDLDAPSRSVAILVDTSASMRAEDLWQQTVRNATRVIDDLRPIDHVSLIAFDRVPRVLVSLEAWENTDASQRVAVLREQLNRLQPSWHKTDLGGALALASDQLLQQRLEKDHNQALQIVVCTDLQEGSSLDSLQTYQWAEDVIVDLQLAVLQKPTNASVQLLPPAVDESDADQVRVLVRNEVGGELADFQLQWVPEASDSARDAGAPTLPSHQVHIPPGQTRVVRISQPHGVECLSVSGDDHSFDNELWITETQQQTRRLLYWGSPEELSRPDGGQANRDESTAGLYFFLRQASLDTRGQHVEIEQLKDPVGFALLDARQTPLVVVASPLEGAPTGDLQQFVRRGGRVLVVLHASTTTDTMQTCLAQLLDVPDLAIEPASVANDYAMLSRINFQHPLFAPFADPRFSDFTKIRFWKHCCLTTRQADAWTTVAQFDDDLPALVEKKLDEGAIWVLTSGWNTGDSQLGLSSKFVPLLLGMFGYRSPGEVDAWRDAGYAIGESVSWPIPKVETMVGTPEGATVSLPADTLEFTETDSPGLYTFRQGEEQFSVAVNVAAEESRTRPMSPDRLEQFGVGLGKRPPVEVALEQQRQMRNVELETRQKLWRWGIVAALIVITLETWLVGRSQRAAISAATA